jgi:predicted metal-dependent hydrolase
MDTKDLWDNALKEHNSGDYHEAHELFEDLWLELDNRQEKDTVQTLAQADALAVHIETGNMRAAQRLMRQLPELLQTFPENYKNINLRKIRIWIEKAILQIPSHGEIKTVNIQEPPKLNINHQDL